MDHVVILGKLFHTLPHRLRVIRCTAHAGHRFHVFNGAANLFLFWNRRLVVPQKVVLFHGERIQSIVLFEVVKVLVDVC